MTVTDSPPRDPNNANANANTNANVDVTVPGNVNAGVYAQPSEGLVVPIPLEYGLDLGVATMRSSEPAQGYGGMFAIIFNAYANQWLGAGIRGQLVYSPDPGLDGPMLQGHVDDNETDPLAAWSFTAGPRLRPWSDPAARLRWVADLDVGVALINQRSAAPLARITLGREWGIFNGRGNGVNAGLALSVETGFGGASDYQAVFGSTWLHGEGGVDAASDPGPHDGRFPSTFTVDFPLMLGKNFGSVYADIPIGVSVAYGVGVSKLLEPRVRLDTLALRHGEGDSTKMIGGSLGVRVRQKDGFFLDLYGGYEHAWGIEPLPIGSGTFVDIGAGLHNVFCRYAMDIGARFRLGVGADNDKLKTLVLVLGGARGNTEGALGPTRNKCK